MPPAGFFTHVLRGFRQGLLPCLPFFQIILNDQYVLCVLEPER
jgi:hypothetical protein